MPELVVAFALAAVVLTVSALASGIVERAPVSFPIIFLGLGFLIGERGFGLLTLGPEDPTLETIAILTLALVLFLDAVRMEAEEVRGAGLVPMLSLGPGTLIIIFVAALGANLLLGTTLVESLLLGTILASTDAVVLRDVVRNERIPRSVRRALSIEAGTNDVVVLPILLVLIAVANAEAASAAGWVTLLAQVLLLGPLVGFVVGAVGAWSMAKADTAFGISREYQALYGIGLVLLAYAGAQSLGGDGFLAAFAAGLAVAVLNFDLCDCFLDYGETTTEMTMLLSFILFGVVISRIALEVPLIPVFILAVVVIFVARPLAIGLVLRRAAVSDAARAFIGWFGPRGLNSLLLALLVVQNEVANAEFLLAVTGLVVTVSVVVHGASATPLSALYGRAAERRTLQEEREGTAAGLFEGPAGETPRIKPQELAKEMEGTNPPIILDVRTRSQYERDKTQIPGSIRVTPDLVEDWAKRLIAESPDGEPFLRPIATYCT
ncbi:MAG: cation:proton antiporter [Actinomycetota bacterium]|nr:cation:proton antiporter [Actinomycetota bacterium]